MGNFQAVSVANIQTVKETINDELIESMSLTDNDVLPRMGINLITDIENQDKKYSYTGYQSIARAYKPGNTLVSKLGEFGEHKLKVKPIWTRVPDNIQNYRERGPITVAGVSSMGIRAPQTEFQMRHLANQFGDQVRMNLWHGDRTGDTAGTSPYGLYDGFLTHIKHGVADGMISEGKGNYFDVDPLATGNPIDNYEAALDFWNRLSAYMQGAPKLYFAVSPVAKNRIISGLMSKYPNHTVELSRIMQNPYLFEMPNVELITDTSLGGGDGIIAYTPYVLDYGTDLTRNGTPEGAFIEVGKSPDDFNVVIYQMQIASGTRLDAIDNAHFACSKTPWTTFTKPALTEGVLIQGVSNTSGGTDNDADE